MTVLEVQDTVTGFESLNETVIQRLMATEDFTTLPPSMQKRVLGQMVPSPSWLAAEVSGAAILITHQWVVLIYGDNAVHCVEALIKYRNAIASELGATVTGKMQTPVAQSAVPLSDTVIRREKSRRIKGIAGKVAWTLGAAMIGVVLTLMGTAVFGG